MYKYAFFGQKSVHCVQNVFSTFAWRVYGEMEKTFCAQCTSRVIHFYMRVKKKIFQHMEYQCHWSTGICYLNYLESWVLRLMWWRFEHDATVQFYIISTMQNCYNSARIVNSSNVKCKFPHLIGLKIYFFSSKNTNISYSRTFVKILLKNMQ
jgi:hypothetical protein